ncbi:DNA polymerase III subunit chi [Telmatospirillum sp. J64-1]|uniref:DNA polymerase III subunit chi n=1 Tax=Telmatospirillum sp. J64-1 TaxID=2502183 RepID=UPI00115CB989|nr:DNA polymerase III subunit chi [Telmatospirillum sp. J64-1]
MTRVGFYHLQLWPLDKALPQLLEKVLAAGHRAVVVAGSSERVDYLNHLLWTYDPASWLPHGSAKDGNAEAQPIWLGMTDDNPNGADVLVLTDGMSSDRIGDFVRCLDLFDGNDEAAVQAARQRWARWKAAGHDLTYFQQTERGGWVEKARVKAGEE